jgi:hypothetical protein
LTATGGGRLHYVGDGLLDHRELVRILGSNDASDVSTI